MSNLALPAERRDEFVAQLFEARRAVGVAKRTDDAAAMRAARVAADEVKTTLGERGGAWWDDGAPDLNRKLVKNTPYNDWFNGLSIAGGHP